MSDLDVCPCPACIRARARFPADPPQLPIPVQIYPSTRSSSPLPFKGAAR